MWIKTQQGELFNLDHLRSISASDTTHYISRSHKTRPPKVTGCLDFGNNITLGEFDTYAEAVAYFNQLEKLLTKESDHD